MTKLEAWTAWAEKAMGGNQDPTFTLEKSSLGNAFSCGYDAGMEAARESDRHADALRCALEAMDYCIEDSAELLNERTAQWGSYRKDRQAAMAATLERHRAVAEHLRAMLMA